MWCCDNQPFPLILAVIRHRLPGHAPERASPGALWWSNACSKGQAWCSIWFSPIYLRQRCSRLGPCWEAWLDCCWLQGLLFMVICTALIVVSLFVPNKLFASLRSTWLYFNEVILSSRLLIASLETTSPVSWGRPSSCWTMMSLARSPKSRPGGSASILVPIAIARSDATSTRCPWTRPPTPRSRTRPGPAKSANKVIYCESIWFSNLP